MSQKITYYCNVCGFDCGKLCGLIRPLIGISCGTVSKAPIAIKAIETADVHVCKKCAELIANEFRALYPLGPTPVAESK